MTTDASKTSRYAGLDGLRAVSALWVTAFHFLPSFKHHAPDWLVSVLARGAFGVELFFVLSGFLITGILLRTASLKTFYARRAFRILPPALVYLLALFVIQQFSDLTMTGTDFFRCLLFYQNWSTDGANIAKHYWSLSIEEQFYLFWPVLLLLFRSTSWRLAATLALLAAGPIFRRTGFCVDGFEWRTHVHCDGLLTGCLLAQLWNDSRCARFFDLPVWRKSITFVAIVVLIALCFSVTGETPRPFLWLGKYGKWLLVALLLTCAMKQTGGVIHWLLNCRLMVWVGVMSYSLYVWQQMFKGQPGIPDWMALFPVNFLMSFMFACTSYYLIERPFLHLRDRFERRVLITKISKVPVESGNLS